MAVSIRRCNAADLAEWARLRNALWPGGAVQEHAAELAVGLAENALRGYLGIDATGEAVAFAEISFRPYANGAASSPVPFLEGIWVAVEHRRTGIGAVLIERISADLIAEGFGEICSDADIGNHASHRAHEGWGFSETERVVYFRKALS